MKQTFQNMRKGFIYYLTMSIISASILFSVGCKIQSSSNVYLEDLIDINTSQKPVLAESTLKIEVAGRSAYEKNKGRIKDLLSRHFPDIKDLSCVDSGFKTFVVAKTKIPIWYNANVEKEMSSTQLLSIMVSDFKKGQKSFLKSYLAIAKDKFIALKRDFGEEFSGVSLSEEDLDKITINLQNGQKDPVTIFGICVYVNGQPEPIGRDIVLEGRSSVQLSIPKISIAKAFEAGKSTFLIFESGTPEKISEKAAGQNAPKPGIGNTFEKFKGKK